MSPAELQSLLATLSTRTVVARSLNMPQELIEELDRDVIEWRTISVQATESYDKGQE